MRMKTIIKNKKKTLNMKIEIGNKKKPEYK